MPKKKFRLFNIFRIITVSSMVGILWLSITFIILIEGWGFRESSTLEGLISLILTLPFVWLLSLAPSLYDTVLDDLIFVLFFVNGFFWSALVLTGIEFIRNSPEQKNKYETT